MEDPDADDMPSLVSIDWGGAEQFIIGKFPNFVVAPKSNDTAPRKYQVNITVRDDNPKVNYGSYSFYFLVPGANSTNIASSYKANIYSQNSNVNKSKSSIKARMLSISK